jgi:hypothetical protein
MSKGFWCTKVISIKKNFIPLKAKNWVNISKSSQRMNLRDVGSETSVNDNVQTNTNDK